MGGMLPFIPPTNPVPYAGGFNYFNMPFMGEPQAAFGGGLGTPLSAGSSSLGGILGSNPVTAESALGSLGNLGGMSAGAEAGGLLGGVSPASGLGGIPGFIGAGGDGTLGLAADAGGGGLLSGLGFSAGLPGGLATTIGAPAAIGLGGKFLVDRLPFIPGSANDPGSAKSVLGNTAAGAGLGAGIGTAIEPGLGTLIGGGVGAAGGAIYGLFHHSSPSGPSPEDKLLVSHRNYSNLLNQLAGTGPTGQAAAQQYNQLLQMYVQNTGDKNGVVSPQNQQKLYDQFSQQLMGVYGQALQQDTAHNQLMNNMNQFQSAWSQFSKSQPFKASSDQYLKDELQRSAYMQSLAGGLKNSPQQTYAKYLIGQQLQNAYAAVQQQQAQLAMEPYQLAMMLFGGGLGQVGNNGGSSSSSSSTSSNSSSANGGNSALAGGLGANPYAALTAQSPSANQSAALLQLLTSGAATGQ